MNRSPLRVLALAPYPEEAPSTRVRLSQFGDALDREGVDLHVRPFFSTEAYHVVKASPHRAERGGRVVAALADALATLRAAAGYDVVWVQRGVAPFLDGWALDALLRSGVPLVYDFDDAVYLPQAGGRPWVERLRDSHRVTSAFCRNASRVLAGNEYLADFARSAVGPEGAHRVQVLPSVVDTARLAPGVRRREGPVVVGWMGSDTTVGYLESLLAPLRDVTAAGGCRVAVVAGSRRPRLPGLDFTFEAWSETREADLLRSLDVGLYPLDDSPWSRGKCGYKAVQYMACGVPCVASPVGVLPDMVVPGITGFLATSPEEWVEALGRLLSDAEARARMGREGRAMVQSRYSVDAVLPRLTQALHEAARDRHG